MHTASFKLAHYILANVYWALHPGSFMLGNVYWAVHIGPFMLG